VRRLLIALLCALALPSLVLASDVTVGQALPRAATNPLDWELMGLTDPVLRLFTPSSGVLFAQTATELVRSDDAGATWGSVSLAPATRLLSSDPIQHTILYAAGPSGVYKTTDDAITWAPILAYGPGVGGDALALAVSPADPSLLYLGVGGGRGAPLTSVSSAAVTVGPPGNSSRNSTSACALGRSRSSSRIQLMPAVSSG
jgi:hypothetical protein